MGMDYDKFFTGKKKQFLGELTKDFRERVSQAADKGYVKKLFLNDLENRQTAYIEGAVGGLRFWNSYINDLIETLRQSFKLFNGNPVARFMDYWPELRQKHQGEIQDGHVQNYTYKKDYIAIDDPEKILEDLAHWFAIDEMKDRIRKGLGDERSEPYGDKVSFKWSRGSAEPNQLLSLLRNHDLIDPVYAEKDFEDIFAGVLNIKPLMWKGSLAQLIHLFGGLVQWNIQPPESIDAFIENEELTRAQKKKLSAWLFPIIIKCFRTRTGGLISIQNLVDAKNYYANKLSRSGKSRTVDAEVIDRILKALES